MSIENKEFLHGLQEYCNYKGSDSEAHVKKVLDILYADDLEEALVRYLLDANNDPNTKYFRFIRDFIKQGKDLKVLSDAMSRSQMKSKIWLVTELQKISYNFDNILILAGWFGQLVELFGEGYMTFSKLRNVEIDRDACIESDYNFNLDRLENFKVKAVNADINNLTLHTTGYEWEVENFKTGHKYTEKFAPDLIINTSSEHMEPVWYDQIRFKPWKTKPIVAIQSNNYFGLSEHINCMHSVNHMKKVYPMSEIYYAGELQLKGYKRIMLIGKP
jgi:hypothetical protein